jgi:invasion protein IalB
MTQNRLTLPARFKSALSVRTLLLPALLFLAAAAAMPAHAHAQAQAPTPAAPPSLTGNWKIHIAIGGNEQDQKCSFTQTDKALAGTCDSDRGEVKVTGSVDGNKATWKFDSEYQGTPITLTYTGAFDDKGKLSGSVEVQPFNVTGDFEVSPADAAAPATAAAAAPNAAASAPTAAASGSPAATASSASGTTAPISVGGSWHVHSTVSGSDYESDCTIIQTDKAIAGTCKSDNGESKIAGTVDGPKATWKFDSEYQGTPINLTYTGAFDDKGKFSGIVDVQPFDVSGNFLMTPATK